MPQAVHTSKLLHNLLITGLVIAAMVYAHVWLIPVSWGFLFACLLFPAACWLESKKINRTISSILVTVGFCALMAVVLYLLISQAFNIIQNNDDVLHKIKDGFESAVLYVQRKTGLTFYEPAALNENLSSTLKSGIGALSSQLSTVGENLLTIGLTPIFMFFILNYRGLLKEFFQKNYTGERLENIDLFLQQAMASVKNYLWGTMILTVVTAVMTYMILMLFGIQSAIFFSVFLAILNIIPYLGNLIAYIAILSFVWLTKDSAAMVLYVTLALYVSNMIQENILRPKLVGDKMEINAFMVLSAVMLGAIIWGVSGMVLFVPFLGIFKAFVVSNPEWNKYAVLFASGEKKQQGPIRKLTTHLLSKRSGIEGNERMKEMKE